MEQQLIIQNQIPKLTMLAGIFAGYTYLLEWVLMDRIGWHHHMDIQNLAIHTIGDLVICFAVSKGRDLINIKAPLSMLLWGIIANRMLHMWAEPMYHHISDQISKSHELRQPMAFGMWLKAIHLKHHQLLEDAQHRKLATIVWLKVFAEEITKSVIYRK